MGQNQVTRIHIPAQDSRKGALICRYEAEHAAWVWHSGGVGQKHSFVEFSNKICVETPETLTVHLSADNRYEAYLDGEYFSMGPDRSDLNHWSFASYRIELSAGEHEFCVYCWHLSGAAAPTAQTSWAPGFLFAVSEKDYQSRLNTGGEASTWLVREVHGISFDEPNDRMISLPVCVDGRVHFHSEWIWEPPCVVQSPRNDNEYGGLQSGWILHPSTLPDQLRREYAGIPEVRAVFDSPFAEGIIVEKEQTVSHKLREYQKVFDQQESLTLPPRTTRSLLLDLHDYLCAYPELDVEGGADSELIVSWQESLYLADSPGKGNRDEILGKRLCALQSDCFRNLDSERRTYRPLWWRSGRYLLLRIRTGESPLTFHGLRLLECRYPWEPESRIDIPDPSLMKLQPFMIRTLQACMHETYMDCPFYEQLMYVGDTRLEALTTYVLTRDASLPERAVSLFDWSRKNWDGLVSEHYPSSAPQLSATFSMLWPLLVKDLLMYRGIPDHSFYHLRNSVRSMLLAISEYLNPDHLLGDLPGWSFVDWCPEWNIGIPYPLSNRGVSSIFSLHYLLSLKTAMELEDYLPDPVNGMRTHWNQLYESVKSAVYEHFWTKSRGLFSDDRSREHFSTHAQCLALLADALSPQDAYLCFDAMTKATDLSRPTVYFSHYYFETLAKFKCGGMIADQLALWKTMKEAGGAVSTWESPEPARSDCHAWGAHPLYQFYSTLAGIRPTAPGFRKMLIAPQLGAMETLSGVMAHPLGRIVFDYKIVQGEFLASVTLPEGTGGTFRFCGFGKLLHPGENAIKFKLP